MALCHSNPHEQVLLFFVLFVRVRWRPMYENEYESLPGAVLRRFLIFYDMLAVFNSRSYHGSFACVIPDILLKPCCFWQRGVLDSQYELNGNREDPSFSVENRGSSISLWKFEDPWREDSSRSYMQFPSSPRLALFTHSGSSTLKFELDRGYTLSMVFRKGVRECWAERTARSTFGALFGSTLGSIWVQTGFASALFFGYTTDI